MQQEINLYPLLPQRQKSFLTLRLLIMAYSSLLVLLFIQCCFEYWGMRQQKVIITNLVQERNQIQQRKEAIHAEYPMLDPKDMENSLKKLQQGLTEKNTVFNLLTQDKKFSNYLMGVAKAAVNDLWLNGLRVDIGDRNLVLKGVATKAEAIQMFINKLGLQTEFAELNFQLQDVHKVEIKKEVLLNFIISTKVKAENEA